MLYLTVFVSYCSSQLFALQRNTNTSCRCIC